MDDEIDEAFVQLINHIEELMNNGTTIPHLVQTVAMLRNIERAGDHTKNICEHLIIRFADSITISVKSTSTS